MEQEMHLSRIRDVKELAVLSDEARDVKEEMLDSSGHQVRTPTVARIKNKRRVKNKYRKKSKKKRVKWWHYLVAWKWMKAQVGRLLATVSGTVLRPSSPSFHPLPTEQRSTA